MRLLAAATLLVAVAPSSLEACTCVVSSRPEAPWTAPTLADRTKIFVGHVLAVDRQPNDSARQMVTFVTESSWRTAMADTVTLRVSLAAVCASYAEGGRYLVLADTTANGAVLVTAPCDGAWSVRSATTRDMLAELGPPSWTAPRMGARRLDARERPIGTPINRAYARGLVAFIPPGGGDVARFEIGDWSGSTSPTGGPVLYAEPGLYQFRITWPDGTSYASYLQMRCDPQSLPDLCLRRVFVGGLR